MIWLNLLLFAVSFIVTALLQPTPDIENARQQNLNPDSFPKASESDPIPFVLGTVRQRAPNTIWYGDYSTRAITKRVKVGLFKKKTIIVGYEYFLAFDLAVALGEGVTLEFIELDDKEVFTGPVSGVGLFSINRPSLFGGRESGGGFVGGGTFYPGDFTQPVDSYLLGRSADGLSADNVSSYPGVSHLVFGPSNIGESPQLRRIAFGLSRFTNGLGISNNARVGAQDINPCEALFQVLTDEWGGMGIESGELDIISFQTAAETLLLEGNGCSVIISREQEGKSIVDEILRQIDAVLTQEVDTGRVTIDLIRNDYDVQSLPVLDEDDILNIRNFSRTTFEGLAWEVKVQHPQLRADSDAISTAQDTSIVAMIGNRAKSVTVSYPFVYSKTLANTIAARERGQLSTPLFRVTLEVNRNANNLRPGSLFRLSFPDYGIVEIVFRIQSFDLGELAKGRIVVEALQDSFASGAVVFLPGGDSQFIPPITDPVSATIAQAFEVPRNLAAAFDPPLEYGDDNSAFLLVAAPDTVSSAFTVVATESDGAVSTDQEDVLYPAYGVLLSNINLFDSYETGVIPAVDVTFFSGNPFIDPEIPTEQELGEGLILIGNELMLFETASDNMDGSFTLNNVARGVLGSEIEDHVAGANVFEITSDVIPFDEPGLEGLSIGDAVDFEVLNSLGDITQGIGEGLTVNYIVTGEAERPVRPRNIQVDGSRTGLGGLVQVDAEMSYTFSGSRTNGQDPNYQRETDPDQAPQFLPSTGFNSGIPEALSERYEFVLIDGSGTPQNLGVTPFGVSSISSSFTIPAGVANGDGRIEVRSETSDGVFSLRGMLPVRVGDEVTVSQAARYWRVRVDGSLAGSFIAIGEIEMRDSIGGTDLTTVGQTIFGAERTSFPAIEAFDDDNSANNGWGLELALTPNQSDRWVGQDFVAPVEILELALTARNDGFFTQAPNGFRLEWSDDLVVWTPALIRPSEPNWSQAETRLYSAPVGFQYWRILCVSAPNASFFGIAEIEMRSTVGGTDLTTTGQAIFGDERVGFEAANAFDDVIAGSNAWGVENSVTSAADRWVGQNFGVPQNIVEIVVSARDDTFATQCPTDFVLQSSPDNSVWTTALTVSGEPAFSQGESRTFAV